MPNSLIRKPYASELEYFKKNPNVSGMATEDDRVILNPYSKLSKEEFDAVAQNETARIAMRKNPELQPNFELTEEQKKMLSSGSYADADEVHRKATVAARILSGDPSAGTPTEEQLQFVDKLRSSMSSEEKPTKMAKGGTVKSQTKRLLAKGGLKQEGNTTDPVSGNNVPVGAMQEEVRDDIPAQLSEGEFVFPADVVRFIGLERLMVMRQMAKKGLMQMEEMGQMSNGDEADEEDDVAEFESEIDEIMGVMQKVDGEREEEDEESREMAEGGMVTPMMGAPATAEETPPKTMAVPFAGEFVTVPTSQAGVTYEPNEIDTMLATGKLKPIGTYKTMEEATAATASTPTAKMAVGGMAMPQAPAPTPAPNTPQAIPTSQAAPAPMMQPSAGVAEEIDVPTPVESTATEGLKTSDIIRNNLNATGNPEQTEMFIKQVALLERANKALSIRHNDTVVVGFVRDAGVVDPMVFSENDPEQFDQAINVAMDTFKKAGVKRLESSSPDEMIIEYLTNKGFPVEQGTPESGFTWALDL